MRVRSGIPFVLSGVLAASVLGCGGLETDGSAVEEARSALTTFTSLTLQNGWTNSPFGTSAPATALVSGIVYFRGAMSTSGTNTTAFTLPVGRRPSSNVYLPVNLCGATKGRLFIPPSGIVQVVAEGGAWANAQCFTSLEGVSFAVSTSGYTALTPQNGWTNAPFSTRNASVTIIGDIVHFAGAIATTGSNMVPFTLPIGFAPSFDAYLPVDTFAGTKGRLFINLSGQVTVQAEGGVTSNATRFTSLEGVSYPLNPASGTNFTCLDLQNGWTGKPFNTRMPCVRNDNGIVRFLGAVANAAANPVPVPITLPASMRPSTNRWIEADMCDAAQGRVLVQPDGTVTVQAKNGIGVAKCFTSFEGVQFGL